MGGITNPAEEYFKDGIWGWATNKWEKLVSYGGRLFTALHGWDGTAWHKLPMVFGYSDRWVETASGQADGAGHAVATSAEVDPGYIYVLQAFSVYHNAGAANQVVASLMTTGPDMVIFDDLTVPSDEYQPVQCECVLKATDFVEAIAITPGDDKWCFLHLWGYKMKVAE